MMTDKEKLIELLTDRIPGIDNELQYVDDERVERLADHLIANGVTLDNQVSSSKWISVKDRLPEIEQEVIVYTGKVLKPSVFAYHFWQADMDSWARVTHWMPLPQPPKGE